MMSATGAILWAVTVALRLAHGAGAGQLTALPLALLAELALAGIVVRARRGRRRSKLASPS